MSEEVTSVSGQSSESAVSEAVKATLSARLEELVRSAEEASRKANSEAGFAFNAKQQAEDHTRTISQMRGTLESDVASTRRTVEESAQAITGLRKEAEEASRVVVTSKADAESSLAAIRAAQEKSQAGVTAVEAAQTETAATRQRVSELATEVSNAKANVETQASAVQAQHTQVTETAAQVKVDAAAVKENKKRGDTHLSELATVVETAKTAQAKVTEYEGELGRLRKDFEGMRSQIEALLPGATSAGLASAFQSQKGRFVRPQWISLAVFLVAVTALAIVGWTQVRDVTQASAGTVATWDLILRHFANRLLLVGPFVWIALVAYRSYSTAQRVQEDYAYKEALSRSFEGYKREMANLPLTTGEVAPLLRLCENVLVTLAQRPGRLYEGKHDDITPLTPVLKTVTEMTNRLGELLKRDKE